jgi:hypothetical protein
VSVKSREVAIEAAVQAWCKKYEIRESDPMRGIAEIFEIYLGHQNSDSQTGGQAWIEAFGESVDVLNQRIKGFTKAATDLSSRIQGFQSGDPVGSWSAIFKGGLLFAAGLAAGRFLL